MVCSDLSPVSEKARSLHLENQVSHLIEYAELDATTIPYPDNTFDFVVFKSVLGAIGRNDHPENQQQAINEIHRVLKPGGFLFFAENLSGSSLHRIARNIFVPWGKSWRYVSVCELNEWLSIFETKEIYTTGFLAAFVSKPKWLKKMAANLDSRLVFLPSKWRYVAYGHAQKNG